MMSRVVAITMNAFREAVRARVLHALLALALATCAYAVLVAALSIHEELRVVADLGAASISLSAAVVAIVLGSTTLHREIEYKTIFPLLTRALRRHEYLVGKYLGTLLTIAVFVAIQAAVVLAVLALEAGGNLALAGREIRLVLASSVLTLCESAIVVGLTTVFASFSSPALTAVYSGGVFLVGRHADALAHLPSRYFPEAGRAVGRTLSFVFPNLNLYAPPRALLLGEVAGTPLWPFVAGAAQNALLYAVLLVTMGVLLFQRRDFP
ncbi:ABC transporter permease [Pendulispora brunnea]|uniref:ABC transporter permease n=1 Tax=Pendulispora brunnea TaxID=2905690 RepID=A0ABZ2JX69_9BACT